MSQEYKELFSMILDEDQPDPVIVLMNEDHLARVRAALSRHRREYIKMVTYFGGNNPFAGKQFKYTKDEVDPSKITISLVDKEVTQLTILNKK